MSTAYELIETHLILQSAEYTETSNGQPDHLAQEQIVFADTHIAQRIRYGDLKDDSYDADTEDTALLATFLNRPVKIHSFTWDLENASYATPPILPWQLYFNHPVIKNKLENFSRLRCNLNIKVVVNATPFYYGSLRLAYQPLPDARSNLVQDNDLVPLSQLPGFYIEPQAMTTSEIQLPFAWPGNWLDAGEDQAFQYMGQISFIQYIKLRSANGTGSAGITVAVFAWASDVEIAGPTYAGALQSDEYEEKAGTISAPATAIANVADKLTDVPYIGSLATATAMGARAVSGIAKLFGYSNPPMIDDVHAFQNKTFHAFANCETRMPIDKLALDPKNEVTISSKVAGIDEPDPLAFKNILTKESYLDSMTYTGSNNEETLLWSCYVSPMYQVYRTAGGGAYFTMTPLGYIGNMFRFWRGSIIYKFRIIKTQYHKGRLTITWDPNLNIVGSTDSDSACFTRIVDLETDEEIEIEIPYRATTPFLHTELSTRFSSSAAPVYPTLDKSVYNGCLTVRVQNILTGPAINPEIEILVYQRAGDDFLYAAPESIRNTVSHFDPAGVIQSSFEPELNVEKNLAQKSVGYDDKVAMVTTGENIVSLRPLLHRTSLSCVQQLGFVTSALASGNAVMGNFLWRVPVGVGRTSQGYHLENSVPGIPYSFSANHPIDWILEMFMGYRGSINVHINPQFSFSANTSRLSHLSVTRFYDNPIINTGTATDYFRNAYSISAGVLQPAQISRAVCTQETPTSGVKFDRVATGQSGTSLTNPDGQPALSINLPQYNKNRFYPAFHANRNFDYCTGDNFYDEVRVQGMLSFQNAPSAANNDRPMPMFQVYYGAGVDFQPIWFLCTPRLFDLSSIPQPKTVV